MKFSKILHDPFNLCGFEDDFDAVSFAVAKNGDALANASYRIRNNPELVSILLEIDPYILKYCTPAITKNTSLVRKSIASSPCTILHADTSFLSNKQIVLFCIEKCLERYRSWCPFNLYHHLDAALQNDEDVIRLSLRYKSDTFNNVSKELPFYRTVVKEFLELNPRHIIYLSEEFLDDEEIVHHYIRHHYDSGAWFLYVSERLRNDTATVKLLIKNSEFGLKYVGKQAKKNIDILKFSIMHNSRNFNFIPVRHRRNETLINLALDDNGFLLFSCRYPFTPSMILRAIAQNPSVYNHLPPEMQSDRALFLTIVREGHSISSKFSPGYRDYQNWIQLLYHALAQEGQPIHKICHYDIARAIREFIF